MNKNRNPILKALLAFVAVLGLLFAAPSSQAACLNITNASTYDPKAGEACEQFVHTVVKAYVARIRAAGGARP